jgi:hypothetical protein
MEIAGRRIAVTCHPDEAMLCFASRAVAALDGVVTSGSPAATN